MGMGYSNKNTTFIKIKNYVFDKEHVGLENLVQKKITIDNKL